MNESTNPYRNINHRKNDDLINLVEIFQIIKKSINTILIFTVVFAIAAGIYTFRQPEIYRAEALVTPIDRQGATASGGLVNQFSGLAGLMGINNQNTSNIAVYIAILRSRTLLEGFIKARNLIPDLFPEEWNKQTLTWNTNEPPNIKSAIDKLQSSISVEDELPLRIIAVEWTDPVLAAEWSNELVKYLNNHIRQQRIEEANKSIFFLEEQLDKTSLVENESMLFDLIEEQTKNIVLANVREEYAFKFIDPAAVPEQVIRPLKLQTVVFGTIVGFILSLFLVFIRAYIKKIFT